jgi:hypothetical protein
MRYIGESYPQERLALAHGALINATESRMHPGEGQETLAIYDGIVVRISDEGAAYRYDLHGVQPCLLKPGERYRSIAVNKLTAINGDTPVAKMSLMRKLSGIQPRTDVVVDDFGQIAYFEHRYDASWSMQDLEQPPLSTIEELNGLLNRSLSVFMPQEELQDIFSNPTKQNQRKWDTIPQLAYGEQARISKMQQLLSRIAMLRS